MGVAADRAIGPCSRDFLSTADQRRLAEATQELLASLLARPDDWTSHYNLGNFYYGRKEFSKALEAFDTATRLNPESILPLVNLAMVHARRGHNDRAETALRQALQVDPNNATANFNLGLLLAEQGKMPEAEAAFRTALKNDPQFPEAAYNGCCWPKIACRKPSNGSGKPMNCNLKILSTPLPWLSI